MSLFSLLVCLMGIVDFLAHVAAVCARLYLIACSGATGAWGLRFSLRTLIMVTIAGGICAALIAQPDHPMVCAAGVVLTAVYIATLASQMYFLGKTEHQGTA